MASVVPCSPLMAAGGVCVATPILGGAPPPILRSGTAKLAAIPLSPDEVIAQLSAARANAASIDAAVAASNSRTSPSLIERAGAELREFFGEATTLYDRVATGFGDAATNAAGAAGGAAVTAAQGAGTAAGGLAGAASRAVAAASGALQTVGVSTGIGLGVALLVGVGVVLVVTKRG